MAVMLDKSNPEKMMEQMREAWQFTDPIAIAKDEAAAFVQKALSAAQKDGALPGAEAAPFVVEQPADPKNGDLACNIAMVNAKTFGMAPRKIAEALLAAAPPIENSIIEKVEVAGPGFINLYLAQSWFSGRVMQAVVCGEDYGRTHHGKGEKVNVEFVSANPTGPMHLGNARGGALGDVLASCFDWAGYEVEREFYINDAGNQITKFGKSLAARYLQQVKGEDAVEFPEDGYQGEDIKERAAEFLAQNGPGWAEKPEAELEQALVDYALPKNIQDMQDHLAKYRISYDVWFRESSLHQSGAVERAIDKLKALDATYEKEGALWMKGDEDDKDNVLVRANGVPTYFAADIAYHIDKFERGFTSLIDVWGADHHGHIARMQNALTAAGYKGEALDVVLMQFVKLVRDGQPVRMSKRTGKAITLSDLLDEVPIDSARFLFNMREPGSSIEFDLDQAVAQDSDNPVYYVQYAHARICSIERALAEESIAFEPAVAFGGADRLTTGEERDLIRKVAAFPGVLVTAATGRNPAGVTRYLMDLATGFHKFYTACHIKGEEAPLLQARLALALATKNVLKNGLSMLKVTVPDKM
ncbi:arginine--tRNA ligase [Ruminococcaceae bacterium OttesenSCG-928-D13]|nr:arginine--tRNA ligase [Ruminococcaceae bacterium OttesenSCG-928-D13]